MKKDHPPCQEPSQACERSYFCSARDSRDADNSLATASGSRQIRRRTVYGILCVRASKQALDLALRAPARNLPISSHGSQYFRTPFDPFGRWPA
jgi:hypothetical protein